MLVGKIEKKKPPLFERTKLYMVEGFWNAQQKKKVLRENIIDNPKVNKIHISTKSNY